MYPPEEAEQLVIALSQLVAVLSWSNAHNAAC